MFGDYSFKITTTAPPGANKLQNILGCLVNTLGYVIDNQACLFFQHWKMLRGTFIVVQECLFLRLQEIIINKISGTRNPSQNNCTDRAGLFPSIWNSATVSFTSYYIVPFNQVSRQNNISEIVLCSLIFSLMPHTSKKGICQEAHLLCTGTLIFAATICQRGTVNVWGSYIMYPRVNWLD